MAAQRNSSPIFASPLLWGVILLATAAVIVTNGVWAGLAVFASAVVGVALAFGAFLVVDRATRAPKYDNKLDPWDD